MAALSIRSLSKRYANLEVLKGIDLDIESGEFTVLVGPSGCGKSTLLNIVAGLDRPSAGTVEIGGRVVNDIPPKDRDIAMVFQSYALYPSMTVRQNITFGMECRHVPKAEQEKALANVARLLQIEPLLGRKPSQLSGGQRQRVAMGRALVRDPLLFLFDEPLSNLDAKLRVEMRMEIKRLHQRIGATIIYVTHDQIEAMTMATRIAVMHRGVVQQFADPDTVYRYPANLFVARFMGSPPMNTMPARLEADAGGPVAVIGAGRPDEVRLRLGQYDAAARFVGRDVVVGIRPECIAEGNRVFSSDAPVIVDGAGGNGRADRSRNDRAAAAWRRACAGAHHAGYPAHARGDCLLRARHAAHLPVRPRNGAADRMTRTTYSSLAGRVVLITGGASGIGAAFVRAFAAQRARVAFFDLDASAGEALVAEVAAASGTAPLFVPCDLLDIDALRGAMAQVHGSLGDAAVLVNNAANDQRQVLAEVTPAEFDWTIGVNLKHVFFAAQAVVPQMQARGGGSIINMSSIAWMRGAPALPVYAAAKAAIVGFTNSLARLVGPDRIRVNAIAPGMVITERQRRLWYPDEQTIAELRTRQAIPDAVTPEDIANMALFLASDESQRITRQCFQVDGGIG
ncbi:ABC-type sugar transport system ATPase subunit/NAD(P)-dependent dehydrogenase (short-subunit alcohol dehydrogenase family) [Bradyrhizobium sp. LM3.6]